MKRKQNASETQGANIASETQGAKEQLDRAIKYVEDNPRRYILKKRNPELFKRYLHLNIAGHEYAAFGNIFLLRELYLLPVRGT